MGKQDRFLEAIAVFDSLTAFAMGRKRRCFNPLDFHSEITIAGETLPLRDAARKHAPVLYIDPKFEKMRPVGIYFDSFAAGHIVFFNYYVLWPDEIAPGQAWHGFYRAYRILIYGSALDIEYVQLGVDVRSGDIVHLAFEREPTGKYEAPVPRHSVVVARRAADPDVFSVTVNGEPVDDESLDMEHGRVKLIVATWNHIYDFYRGMGEKFPDLPVAAMTDAVYEKHCMLRRSRPPYC